MIICLLNWLLTKHIPIVRFRLCIGMEIKVCKQVGVMHVLSMLMGFDMGSFLVGHILDNRIIMGWTPKFQIIKVQNPTKSHHPNLDLVWKKGEWHGSTNKITIECSSIPHGCVHEVWEGEWGDLHTPIKWNFLKMCLHKRILKTQQLGTILGILGKCHIPYLCHLMLVC
jgi:hypothetical protein